MTVGDDSARTPGELLDAIRLKGELPAGGSPWLCRSATGLWLCDQGEAPSVHRELRDSELRYEPGRLGDTVCVGEQRYPVPTGKGAAAKKLIALGRLASLARDGEPPQPSSAPLLDSRDELEAAWLRGALDADEPLLAFLHSASSVEVESPLGPSCKVPGRFVLTTARAMLVAVGELGDALCLPLPEAPLRFVASLGRAGIESGEQAWLSPLGSEDDYRTVAELPGRSASERLVAVIAASARDGETATAQRVEQLSACLANVAPEWAALVDFAHGRESEAAALAAALAAVVEGDDPERLRRWAEQWQLEPDRTLELVRRMRELDLTGPASAALHRPSYQQAVEQLDDPGAQVALDLDVAQHLAAAGQRDDAVDILEHSLTRLPAAELLDLLPPPDVGEEDMGGQRVRLSVLDALVELRGASGEPHVPTLTRLAQLAPLELLRVEALAAAAPRALAQRAEAVARLLAPDGLQQAPAEDPPSPKRALNDAQLFEVLQHPVAREGGALAKLQGFLASAKVPDHGALRSYCQRLGPKDSEAAAKALTDAVLALGCKGVEAYLSRGDRSIGVRAYEGDPSFLLIGGEHIDEGSAHHMGEGELRFAVGAEMAHLRYGHTRVTSSEVWSGAYEKGKETVGFVLGVLPALKMFKFGARIAGAAEAIQSGPAAKVFETAGRLLPSGASKAPVETSLERRSEELVAAHRVTQLTADRAGLLLCGSPTSALRTMLIARPEYLAELAVASNRGLAAAVTRRDGSGKLLHGELATRVCALLGYYLSDDYTALRARLYDD